MQYQNYQEKSLMDLEERRKQLQSSLTYDKINRNKTIKYSNNKKFKVEAIVYRIVFYTRHSENHITKLLNILT